MLFLLLLHFIPPLETLLLSPPPFPLFSPLSPSSSSAAWLLPLSAYFPISSSPPPLPHSPLPTPIPMLLELPLLLLLLLLENPLPGPSPSRTSLCLGFLLPRFFLSSFSSSLLELLLPVPSPFPPLKISLPLPLSCCCCSLCPVKSFREKSSFPLL